MQYVYLKLVPDAEPNAEGEWVLAHIPHKIHLFRLVPKPGYHVVAARLARDLDNPQDGGPMHAELLGGRSRVDALEYDGSWGGLTP